MAKTPLFTAQSKHNYAYATTTLIVHVILRVHASQDWKGPVVVEVIMQLAITRTEPLLFEEQRVVEQG